MFIAHLPAGYICGCMLTDRVVPEQRRERLVGFLIGSVFPDVDMLYFYLIDQGRHHHHHYWTHLPIFWLAALAVSTLAGLLIRSRRFALVAASFIGGIFLHLILDTPFAGICWLYPLTDQNFYLITVPATRSWWVWSFVFHWSFLFEIAICVAAAVLYFQRRLRSRKSV